VISFFRNIFSIFAIWRILATSRIFGFEYFLAQLRLCHKPLLIPLLRKYGAKIGERCDIDPGIIFHRAQGKLCNFVMEDDCYIGEEVLLDIGQPIIIRKRSTIAARVCVWTHFDVGRSRLGRMHGAYSKPVEIGPDAYIGACAIILPGVKVGEGSIVGAGAVVNVDVRAWTFVAGVPVREIRKIRNPGE
jgi:galactoside O-acetyltransferase